MNTYKVINKVSGKEVYRYRNDVAVEWNSFPFTEYDHIVEVEPVVPEEPVGNPVDWYIDVGPFFDRFGDAKLAVLTNQDVLVKAIIQDVMVRKWVDLKRQDVADAIAVIASKVASVTPELVDSILNTPVSSEESDALRKLYFDGGLNG